MKFYTHYHSTLTHNLLFILFFLCWCGSSVFVWVISIMDNLKSLQEALSVDVRA
jgi:hypothetical protein